MTSIRHDLPRHARRFPRVAPALRVTLFLLPAVAFAALLGCAEPAPVAVGEPAPSFELPAVGGGSLSSEALAGEPAVVAFWATWCRPCMGEIPIFEEIEDEGHAQVVAIALDEEPATVERFVEERAIGYPVALGDQETFQRFDGFAIPHTVVLDPEGTIVAIHRGPAGREALEADLARAAGAGVRRGS